MIATGYSAIRAIRQERRANRNAELRFLALSKVLDSITGDRLRLAGQRTLQVQLIRDLNASI